MERRVELKDLLDKKVFQGLPYACNFIPKTPCKF
jgi:hypothetical protein